MSLATVSFEMTRISGRVIKSSVALLAIQYFMTFLMVVGKISQTIITFITIFTMIFLCLFQTLNRDFECTLGGIWLLIFDIRIIGFCGSIGNVLIRQARDWSV